MTPEQQEAWEQWISERLPAVQEKARAYPVNTQYILKDTFQVVRIASYSENPDGSCTTCTVLILAEENADQWQNLLPGMEEAHEVFGVTFEDLEPVPGPSKSFVCANCGTRNVVLDENEAEAEAEMKRNFPGLTVENASAVCETCYQIFIASFN